MFNGDFRRARTRFSFLRRCQCYTAVTPRDALAPVSCGLRSLENRDLLGVIKPMVNNSPGARLLPTYLRFVTGPRPCSTETGCKT